MHALQQQIEQRERSQHHAARRIKLRRWIGVAVSVASLGVALFAIVGADKISPDSTAAPAPSESDAGVLVDAVDFGFTMVSEPVVEDLEQEVFGTVMQGKTWTIERSDGLIQVLVFSVPPGSLGADVAEGGFDAQLGGMARRSGGTLVVDEPIVDSSLTTGRRGEIEIDGGRLYTEMYARGDLMVAITGAGPGSQVPPDYTALLDSFYWQL